MGNNNAPMTVSQLNTPMKISDPMGRQIEEPSPPSSPSWSTTDNVFGAFLSRDAGTLKRLRRKLKTKLRKSCNHSHVFREFANLLSIRELAHIYEEYKSTFYLKELFLHAQKARPIASNVRNDLSKLYDSQILNDITLVYKNIEFSVHKAIVCVRCPYFRELLSKKNPGSVVEVDLKINELSLELFNDLLKFLYTGELTISYDAKSNSSSYKTLMRISQECGVPNALPKDLRYLFDTGVYSDASLCFQFSSDFDASLKRCLCVEQAEFACHQAILASRSPFFRSVIERQHARNKCSQKQSESYNQRMKIILDESIIPRRYGKIILHIMYRDSEDLSTLVQSSACKCYSFSSSSSSSSSSKENPPQLFMANEMMNLYEIAFFLELDSLIHATEDLIIDLLSIETIIPILKWSGKSHGSSWIERQAMAFLRDEFSSVCSNMSLLNQLDEKHLLEILKSDFVQASELDLFKCIVKWGELKCQNNIFDDSIEQNLISTHTLSRRINRKKEIDDGQLASIISPFVKYIRVGHILPMDCDFLQNSIKRGLIETLPSFMQIDPLCLSSRNYSSWFRNRSNEPFIRPRLFTVYFEECKTILEQKLGYRISNEDDDNNNDNDNDTDDLDEDEDDELIDCDNDDNDDDNSENLAIPDALYMVNNLNSSVNVSEGDQILSPISPTTNFNFCFISSSISSVNGYPNEIDNEKSKSERIDLPVIEGETLLMMRQREKELKSSPFCMRVLKVLHNRCHALRFIQLRVVREFGLPDLACELLNHRYSTNRQMTTNCQISNESENSLSKTNGDSTFSSAPVSSSFPSIVSLPLVPSLSLLPPIPPPRPSKRKTQQTVSFSNNNCDSFGLKLQLEVDLASKIFDSQFSSNG